MRVITTSGQGTVAVKPDITVITFYVSEHSKSYADSIRLAEESTVNIRNTITEFQFDPTELKSRSFSVEPVTRLSNSIKSIVGYQAIHTLSIALKQSREMLNSLLTKLHERLKNTEIRLSFHSSSIEELKGEALKKAVELAMKRASLIAVSANIRLGKIIDIKYAGDNGYRYNDNSIPLFSRGESSKDLQLNIEPAGMSVSDSVTITWEIAE
ncbi:MAG: SIMPL domain-containing protein [Fibrobacteres bacterium]|nr:SIMPL domain-containing protein [Fibrobacterota bacterium]